MGSEPINCMIFYRFGVLSPPHKISNFNYLKITIPQPVFVWLAFCQIRVNLPKLFNVQKVPGWIQNTNVKFGDDIDAYPPQIKTVQNTQIIIFNVIDVRQNKNIDCLCESNTLNCRNTREKWKGATREKPAIVLFWCTQLKHKKWILKESKSKSMNNNQ